LLLEQQNLCVGSQKLQKVTPKLHLRFGFRFTCYTVSVTS